MPSTAKRRSIGKILAFSVSHDHRSVLIYGHYAVIAGKNTKYYRHLIHAFSFIALDGKERWTAYRFIKNVYVSWVPSHFNKICSAIDQLPVDLDFSVTSLPASGLSQSLESHHLPQSDAESLRINEESQPSVDQQETAAPSTSFADQGTAKKKRCE